MKRFLIETEQATKNHNPYCTLELLAAEIDLVLEREKTDIKLLLNNLKCQVYRKITKY